MNMLLKTIVGTIIFSVCKFRELDLIFKEKTMEMSFRRYEKDKQQAKSNHKEPMSFALYKKQPSFALNPFFFVPLCALNESEL